MSKRIPSLQTDIARARGLGAANSGTEHWWMQRLTSIALVPLGLWFGFSVAALAGADYATIQAWMASPLTAALMILFIVIGIYHAVIGVEVIMEDYIHTKTAKLTAIIFQKFFFLLLTVMCVVSVLRVALAG